MTNTYGLLRCPICDSQGKKGGNYRVHQTRNYYILTCWACTKGKIVFLKSPKRIKCNKCDHTLITKEHGN